MARTATVSDEEFERIYHLDIEDSEKAKKIGISPSYMKIKAKKLGIKTEKPAKPKTDFPVIVTETGTYTRSYCTYNTDAVVKAKELRELVHCNDDNFKPTDFSVTKMTEEEIEREKFMVDKLKRNFGDVNV